jgi:ribosome modulation factor
MPHRNQKIFDEGWQAFTDGALVSENPYQTNAEVQAWHDGWCAAAEDYEEQEREKDEYSDRIDFEYDKWRDQ